MEAEFDGDAEKGSFVWESRGCTNFLYIVRYGWLDKYWALFASSERGAAFCRFAPVFATAGVLRFIVFESLMVEVCDNKKSETRRIVLIDCWRM